MIWHTLPTEQGAPAHYQSDCGKWEIFVPTIGFGFKRATLTGDGATHIFEGKDARERAQAYASQQEGG